MELKHTTNHTTRQLKFFEKSLELIEKLLGEQSDEYRTRLVKMGDFYKEINKTKPASEYYEKAIELKYKKAEQTEESLKNVSKELKDIGEFCRIQGESEKAAEYYEKSLVFSVKLFKESSIEIENEVKQLGDFYYNSKQYDKAFAYYERW